MDNAQIFFDVTMKNAIQLDIDAVDLYHVIEKIKKGLLVLVIYKAQVKYQLHGGNHEGTDKLLQELEGTALETDQGNCKEDSK